MRHVPHLVAVAQPHRGAEIVLDDAEVVAVVVDIGRELGLVAPPDDALLAARRGPPVHFQLQLVGLDEPRGISEPLAERPEKEEEAVSLGLVVVEGGVGHRTTAAQDGAARQRHRRIGVPCLRRRGSRTAEQAEGEGGEHRATVHARCTPLRSG